MQERLFLYAGSYGSQGIRAWEQLGDGSQLELLGDFPEFKDHSFLLEHPSLSLLYAAVEGAAGMLSCIQLDSDGRPAFARQYSTDTRHPCHIAISPGAGTLAVSGYNGGFAFFELGSDGLPLGQGALDAHFVFQGSGPREDRQEASHPHSLTFLSEDLAIGADLGDDCLRVFQRQSQRPGQGSRPPWTVLGSVACRPGSGPRHGFAYQGGFLQINELIPEVLWYSPEQIAKLATAGPANTGLLTLEARSQVELLDSADKTSTAAAVFAGSDGRVWATVRGQDLLLRVEGLLEAGGEQPAAVQQSAAAPQPAPRLTQLALPWEQPRFAGFLRGLSDKAGSGALAGEIIQKKEEQFIAIAFQNGGRVALFRAEELASAQSLPEPAALVDCPLCTAVAQLRC